MAAALSLSLLAAALALVPGTPRPPAGWLEGAARPVFRLLTLGGGQLRRGVDALTGTGDLRKENRALKEELAVLRPLARWPPGRTSASGPCWTWTPRAGAGI